MKRALLAVAAVAAAAAIGAGLWRFRQAGAPAPVQSGSFPGANILLITVDTLRADRVGAYGAASG